MWISQVSARVDPGVPIRILSSVLVGRFRHCVPVSIGRRQDNVGLRELTVELGMWQSVTSGCLSNIAGSGGWRNAKKTRVMRKGLVASGRGGGRPRGHIHTFERKGWVSLYASR